MIKWIDINDELPPLDQFVLTTNATSNATKPKSDGLVAIVRRIGQKSPIWWCGYIDTFQGTVTHWIPFPRPPSQDLSQEKKS